MVSPLELNSPSVTNSTVYTRQVQGKTVLDLYFQLVGIYFVLT